VLPASSYRKENDHAYNKRYEHKAKGEIVVQGLEGRVAFMAFGKTQTLEAGKFLFLPKGEPHTVRGIEDASLQLTIHLPKP